MGRLNIGGGGKQVEIKKTWIAEIEKDNEGTKLRSALPTDSYTRVYLGRIGNAYYFAGSGSRLYKIVKTDGRFELVKEIKTNNNDRFMYMDKIYTMSSSHATIYDSDLNLIENIATGFDTRDNGRYFGLGENIVSVSKKSNSDARFYIYGSEITADWTEKQLYKGIEVAEMQFANAFRYNQDKLIHRFSPKQYSIVDKDGNVDTIMGTDVSSGTLLYNGNIIEDDDGDFFDLQGRCYRFHHGIFKNTNSIPDPKRKNLSAKFDILPTWMGG